MSQTYINDCINCVCLRKIGVDCIYKFCSCIKNWFTRDKSGLKDTDQPEVPD